MRTYTSIFLLLIANALFFQLSSGQPNGYALCFDGVDDYVQVEDDASLDFAGAFTITAWIYLDSYVEWASIVTKGDNNYTIHQSGPDGGSDFGYLRFTGSHPGLPLYLESNTKVPLNEWHHIALAYDGVNVVFYYDGIADGGGPLSGPGVSNDGPLIIGADFPGAAEYWHGKIDEVKIWNIALGKAHIRAAMNGRATPISRRLVLYLGFNEGVGTIAHDRSRHGNHGQLQNGPLWVDHESVGVSIFRESTDLFTGENVSDIFRIKEINEESTIFNFHNYPNPFTELTTIQFDLKQPAKVKITLFNDLGQRLSILTNDYYTAGQHQIKCDRRHIYFDPMSSGILFYHIVVDEKIQSIGKMFLSR